MNRREFIKASSLAITASAIAGTLPSYTVAADDADPLMRHRFGVNYVPSQNWNFHWNDWKPDAVARDFDRIAEIGADHIRVMLIWPWFQPNSTFVSPAHLDRLDQLMQLAAERKLDVMVTLFTGWLSGYAFLPPFFSKDHFYTAPHWKLAQDLFVTEVCKRMNMHTNFLGCDLGNEMNNIYTGTNAEGRIWMENLLKQLKALCPKGVHVNGLGAIYVPAFTPETQVALQEIVPLHVYPYFWNARKFGTAMQKPFTHLMPAMAALARRYGNAPTKPIWIQEFGIFKEELPVADMSRWLETAVTAAVEGGVSWFTWWGSHDINRRFTFAEIEYDLGLMTADNKIKEHGKMFKKLSDAYRQKPVVIPKTTLAAAPTRYTYDAGWEWMLDWMNWKVKQP